MGIFDTISGKITEKLADQINTSLESVVKGIHTVMEGNGQADMETLDEADCIDNVHADEILEDTKCTCNACVWCTNAAVVSDPVHIRKDGGLVHVQDIEQLNRLDVELQQPFWRCTEAKEDGYVCSVDRESIEGGTWQDVNELDDEGEGMETVSMDSSYMICTKYGGIIYFYDNGQEVLDNLTKILIMNSDTFNLDLYKKYKFYRITADYIAQINETDPNFDNILARILAVYNENHEMYEEISERNGYIPPEVIAAIHYRESAADYLNGTFSIYLHNGVALGQINNLEPKPPFFDENQFVEAALHALAGDNNYFINIAKKLELTPDSKDLTAMVTFLILYNGWQNGGLSSYAYSGTNIYSQGLYTSDHVYDPDAKDQNCGVYLILKCLLSR